MGAGQEWRWYTVGPWISQQCQTSESLPGSCNECMPSLLWEGSNWVCVGVCVGGLPLEENGAGDYNPVCVCVCVCMNFELLFIKRCHERGSPSVKVRACHKWLLWRDVFRHNEMDGGHQKRSTEKVGTGDPPMVTPFCLAADVPWRKSLEEFTTLTKTTP